MKVLNEISKVFFLLYLILSASIGFAQSLPQVIKPSPETTALFRYLDYPVDHSTGVPEINIPIYEIKSGSLTLPISISYHASGRRVGEENGPIASGWTLNCGGMISRTVFGQPGGSRFPDPVPSPFEITNWDNYEQISDFYYGFQHSEYDIFSYSTPSGGGRFIMTNSGAKLIPLKPFLIDNSTSFPSKIIDDKGIVYSFGLPEQTIISNEVTTSNSAITSKYMTKITAPNGRDTISLKYQGFYQYRSYHTETFCVLDQLPPPGEVSLPKPGLKANSEFREHDIKRITEIVFKEGKIVFNLNGTTDRIKSIQIVDVTGQIVKTIEFQTSYLDADGAQNMYKLDKVLFKDRNTQNVDVYSFDYYPTESFTSESRDWWGFRNSSTATGLIPYYDVRHFQDVDGSSTNETTERIGNGANRDSNDTYMKMGVIRKIIFPTGGSTEFSFEGNKVLFGPNIKDCGGLRVNQIKTSDREGNVSVRTFEYGDGYLTNWPHQMYTGVQTRYFFNFNPNVSNPLAWGSEFRSYSARIYSSDIPEGLSYAFNEPVFYSLITEYLGTKSDNIGKISYTYSGGNICNVGSVSAPDFTHVWDQRTGGTMTGVYHTVDELSLPRYMSGFNFLNERKMTSMTHYENAGKDASGKIAYKGIKSVINSYNTAQTEAFRGLHIERFCSFPQFHRIPGVLHIPNTDDEYKAATIFNFPVFVFGGSEIYIGKTELVRTEEEEFSDDGLVTKRTDFTYNSNHLLSERTQYLNNGKRLITRHKYPFDFTTDATLAKMKGLNMLNYVVEEESFMDNVSTPLKSVKTLYKEWYPNDIIPEIISVKQGASSYEPRITFQSYDDEGNILSVSKPNDVKTVYIYSYNKTLPIAKIENADLATVTSVLGGVTAVEAFAKKLNPTNEQVRSFLAPLRNDDRLAQSNINIYTHILLVGVSSVTDQNNITTYYQYDSFNRLNYIKDKGGNVLKHLQYKYATNEN